LLAFAVEINATEYDYATIATREIVEKNIEKKNFF
jgi:hypothetical protein